MGVRSNLFCRLYGCFSDGPWKVGIGGSENRFVLSAGRQL